MISFLTTPVYNRQFNKLDKRQQKFVLKKMNKVVGQPELGKPMHKPLQNMKSQRIENIKMISEKYFPCYRQYLKTS